MITWLSFSYVAFSDIRARGMRCSCDIANWNSLYNANLVSIFKRLEKNSVT